MTDYLHSAAMQVKSFGAPAGTEPNREEGFPQENPQEFPHQPAPALQRFAVPDTRPPRVSGPEVRPCSPGFTLVSGDCRVFAKEYAPKMECPNYIGDTDMILRYLFREERRNHITMPIRTCGIDPIVFENVEHLEDDEEGGGTVATNYFAIPDDNSGDEDANHVYELIEVDGNLYLSCMSECLDSDYLHRIITEATTTMRETGSYIFRMVGLRRLAVNDSDNNVGRLLETLRLNTFEMSALCTYMGDFGVEPSFEIIDGHQCICFRAGAR